MWRESDRVYGTGTKYIPGIIISGVVCTKVPYYFEVVLAGRLSNVERARPNRATCHANVEGGPA